MQGMDGQGLVDTKQPKFYISKKITRRDILAVFATIICTVPFVV